MRCGLPKGPGSGTSYSNPALKQTHTASWTIPLASMSLASSVC